MGIKKKTWKEFQNAGLMWWINRQLHLFGWSIVLEQNENDEIVNCYPAKTDWKGFGRESEERGFERLEKHMKELE